MVCGISEVKVKVKVKVEVEVEVKVPGFAKAMADKKVEGEFLISISYNLTTYYLPLAT